MSINDYHEGVPDEETTKPEVVIDPEVKAIMDSTGLVIEGDFLNFNADNQLKGMELGGKGNIKFEFEKGQRENEVILKLTQEQGRILEVSFNNGVMGFPTEIK